MISAFTHDVKRSIEATPSEDITGLTVLAKVYQETDEGIVYKGIANTVKPDPETAKVTLNVSNTNGASEDLLVTVRAKYRYEDAYTQVAEETLSIAVSAGADYEVAFDMGDYDDVQVEILTVPSGVHIINHQVDKSQFSSLVGVVVGGGAEEAVVIPCDFRAFEAGEYSIVFVAEGYGVIGRDILVVYGADGYSDDTVES